MKYIKRFAQHADYEAYMGGGEVYLPNVCICGDEPNVVHYNPYQEQPEPTIPEIWYEASAKLTETTSTYSAGLHTNAFNTTIQSHTFENGKGKIVFADDVTSIGDVAFYGCFTLTSVTFPNSVTSIGERAFYGCTGLTSVTIGSGVTSIGNSAFGGCSGVKELIYAEGCTTTLPTNLTSITSVTIPNSVTSIRDFAFSNCDLILFTIPNSVTSIGERAFSGCSGTSSVTIPNSVKSIERFAFYECANLYSFIFMGTKSEFMVAAQFNSQLASTLVDYIHCSDGDLDASPWKQSCC